MVHQFVLKEWKMFIPGKTQVELYMGISVIVLLLNVSAWEDDEKASKKGESRTASAGDQEN